MSYVPTTPETVTLAATLPTGAVIPYQQTIDTYQIEEFHFARDANEPQNAQLRIVWSKGFISGESEDYLPVERTENRFEGETLLRVMSSIVSGGSYYDSIRNAMWTMLLNSGAIPPGTVT